MRHWVRLIAGGWLIGKAFDNPPSSLNSAMTLFLGVMVIVYTIFDLALERRG